MVRAAQLGDAESAQYARTAGAAAAAGVSVVSAAAPAILSASAAGPIGAGIAIAALLISHLIANSGCGPTCVLASGIVDKLEPQLKANRDEYLNGPRTAELQTLHLATFDGAWNWLTSSQACGAPQLNDAGRRCISERAPGGKWDWFRRYRDPIAADHPAADPLGTAAAVTGIDPAWLLAGGLLLLGLTL